MALTIEGERNRRLLRRLLLTGITLAEGLRSAALYKLLMAAALFSFTVIGVAVHFVPILTDSGATPLSAAGIASLVGVFSIVGRLGTGFLLDRVSGTPRRRDGVSDSHRRLRVAADRRRESCEPGGGCGDLRPHVGI